MDVIVLPLVWPNTPVAGALEMLHTYKRAGVVRQGWDDTYRLLYAGDLLRAREDGIAEVGQIDAGESVMIVEMPAVTTFSIDIVRPRRTEPQYEQMLDAHGMTYGLVGETSREVMIVTRHEDETETLSGTGGYECTGTPKHFFPRPRVQVNTNCPRYPACSRADGTIPKIRPA
jgi:hypothetical protein